LLDSLLQEKKLLKLKMMESKSPLSKFYMGKTIFITGATGFMGKVLVEKLLRSTGVKKIFLLIRPKKGLKSSERLKELLTSKIFEGLRESSPMSLTKVVAVSGDITEAALGLSTQDIRMLVEEVNIVFHSAATVKFDEDLTKSVAMNVEAVYSLLDICKKIRKLEAVVHVSTAYCNCDLNTIEETISPPPGDPRGVIQLCKWMTEETLNSAEMTAKVIGNRPNTYTFTKALAESVLESERGSLPIAIVRPSIVVAAWREPVPGWVDNLNGPTGLLAGAGKGLLRTLHCKRSCVADLVPVDIPINLMCAVAWKISTMPAPSTIPVYNCTSGSLNPMTWGEMEAWGYDSLVRFPLNNAVWYPGGAFKDTQLANLVCKYIFHSGPAHLVDTYSRLVGAKPVMVKICNKINKAAAALEYFTTNEWTWINKNVISLQEEMTLEDREKFNFDIRRVHWPHFLDNFVQGTRKFVLKEDMSSMTTARSRINTLYWLEKTAQLVMFLMFLKALLGKSSLASKMAAQLANMWLRSARMLTSRN